MADRVAEVMRRKEGVDEFHRVVLRMFIPSRLMEQLRHRHFYRVQARGETLAQYVQRIREIARILGMGMSEEEVVQHILDGVSADDRLRLVFAQRPQWFADLDRLCVMTEAMQMTDHARGDGRGAEPRPQRSEGPREPSFPRQAQPARNREQTKDVYKRQLL